MRIKADQFDGSGAWSTALWPFSVVLDADRQPTRVQSGGLGLVTNYREAYKYARYYFGDGTALQNAGLLVRGRYTTAGTNANARFFIRASRDSVSGGNDLTYPRSGYFVLIDRTNATVTFQKYLNGVNTNLGSFTASAAPGTSWWNLRLEAEGNVVRVKFWIGTLASEPTAYTRTVTDSTNTLVSGEAGFSTGYEADSVMQLEQFETYDFFNALVLGGSITPYAGGFRQVRKRLAGVLAPTGPVASGGNGFGTVPFGSGPFGGGKAATGGSVTTRRVVTRIFAGSITAAGVARRAVVRWFSGSIRPTASYSFANITKRLGGSIAPTQPRVISRTPRRIVGGVIAAVGQLTTRSVGRIQGTPGIVEMTIRVAGEIRSRVRRG